MNPLLTNFQGTPERQGVVAEPFATDTQNTSRQSLKPDWFGVKDVKHEYNTQATAAQQSFDDRNAELAAVATSDTKNRDQYQSPLFRYE